MGNKLFISYSHKDELYREGLATHLASLTRSGDIETWSDRMIRPGEKWNDEIFENLREATVVLFLISSDFINSEFCYDKEVKYAIELEEKNELIIIPVVVRSCVWDETPIARFQALPRNAKPVSLWEDKDQAYHEIVKAIRQRLRNDVTPQNPPPIKEQEFNHDVSSEESKGGFFDNLMSNISEIAKNLATDNANSNRTVSNHNPSNIYGRWQLREMKQNNYNMPASMLEIAIFHNNHAFQLFQNNIQTNYGTFEYNGDVLNITFFNGMLDSRTFYCHGNQLVVYQQINNAHFFYQRV